MSWSFRLVRIAGTDVKVHITFVLFLAWLAAGEWQRGGSAAAAAVVVFLLAIFGCVLLHEFGHILMARRFGVRTPDVILLPIGGLARLERMPDEPRQELLIALAGPLVTLALAGLFYGIVRLQGGPVALTELDLSTATPLVALMRVNVLLLLFNLIPAFPMDGGRVLRSLLAMRLGLPRATRVAATIGQALAVIFAVWAFMGGGIILAFIAFFVFIGAGAEAAAVETRFAGRGLRVADLMMTRFQVLPVHARLEQAAQLLLAGDQREFPVVDNLGALEGLLTRDGLIRGLSQLGPQATAAEAMTPKVPVLRPDQDFDAALQALRESRQPALPVTDPTGRLVGLLSMENVSEALLVRKAVGGEK